MVEFFCTICQESFESLDEIYSTHCGHVFHHRCITDWLTRSSTCSDCRAACSSSDIKKLIITSRDVDSEDLMEQNLKLKSQLEQGIKNLSEIQHMLDESEKNFAELQTQLDAVVQERADLQRELQEMQTLSKSVELELDTKRVENRHFRKELDEAYEKIKFSNDTKEKKKNNMDLSEKLIVKNKLIEELNEKLNEKTLELQKEIRNSTILIVEKMKLQQLLDSSLQRMVSIAGNKQCPKEKRTQQPKQQREEETDMNTSMESLEAQLDKCELNAGVSGFRTVAYDNNRSTGAVQKRPVHNRTRLDPLTFELFQYAKNLRKVGFRQVYFDNMEIFARMDDTLPKIQIIGRQQVDDLLNKFKEINGSITQQDKIIQERAPSEDDACDAQFYAI